MLNAAIIQEIETIVGKENISTTKSERITHSYDATGAQFLPDIVVYPSSTKEISALMKLATKEKFPVIPRGAGSGFTGGTLPVQGGVVLAMSRMDTIIDIDTDNLIAEVEPGVVTAEFQRVVEKMGLFYPPDPASKEFSTLGGNAAECAGGPRCVKYGVTKDYILGLEVVTPDGTIMTTGGRTLKNVVGYDLTKLFVSSEGTLGIITKILLKIIPKPEAKKTMMVCFTTIDGAAQAVSDIIKGKIIPTTLEFMDKGVIDCIRDVSPIPLPRECQAILIIEVDGDAAILDTQAEKILEIVKPLGVSEVKVAANEAESEEIWRVRRAVSPSLRKLYPDNFNEDIVVPRSKLPDMIRKLERISQDSGITIVNFGHAGDGNIHVYIMTDMSETGMDKRVADVIEQVFSAAIALRGSISGEHGIGTAKAKFLAAELDSAAIAAMKQIKRSFDPHNILNPGKIFYGEAQ